MKFCFKWQLKFGFCMLPELQTDHSAYAHEISIKGSVF